MSSQALKPRPAAPPGGPPTVQLAPAGRLRRLGGPLLAAGGGVVLAGISFAAGGGLELEPTASTEIATTLACAVLLFALVGAAARNRRLSLLPLPGGAAIVAFAAFALLTAVSVLWSIEPQGSWLAANRLFAYLLFFACAILLGRLLPRQRGAVLGALVLWSVAVCAYALLTKVFPAQLAPHETYARLQAPYGYWIATGLTAALGAIAALWQAARRDGHALLRVVAYPILTLQLVVLLLTYSRGPLAVLAVALILWFAYLPLRLRSAAALICAAATAAPAVAFAFGTAALAHEDVPLAGRIAAGHQLGVIVAFCLACSFALGLAINYRTAVRPPSPLTRRRAGAALLGLVGLAVLAAIAGLAASHRGLAGTVSHDLSTLFNPNATPPANTPSRLAAVASVRARYWQQGLEVFAHHPLLGVGAEGYAVARLRFRHDTLLVRQAHSFLVQTLADLGLVGLAASALLFLAWLLPARRALRAAGDEPEQRLVAARALLCVVFAFGLHSLVDWTWEVPGTACAALLAAGFLAGSGPPPRRQQPLAVGVKPLHAAGVLGLALGLLLAYVQWQPLRSAQAARGALTSLGRAPARALDQARAAVADDPLSLEARFVLAAVEQARGMAGAARGTLAQAVRLAPADPQTWQALGEYDLAHGNPSAALRELSAALYLNPMAGQPPARIASSVELVALHNAYLRAAAQVQPTG